MNQLPINLSITGKPVIILGGGSVALRKCRTLLDAGAQVTIVAPELCTELQALAAAGALRHLPRPFRAGDLAGALLVFAATDQPEVNRAVAQEATTAGILAEITDAPALGAFTSPAVLSRGELLLAVSTGGRAPALAGVIRRELEERFGPEYGEAVRVLGAVREKLLTQTANSSYNKGILKELAERLPALFAAHALAEIDNLLQERCGPGFSLADLKAAPEDLP